MTVEELDERLLRVECAVASLGWKVFGIGGTRAAAGAGCGEMGELMQSFAAEMDRRCGGDER